MGYNVAMFGAFDVRSYGDSMFPIAIREELSKRIELSSICLFAPEGKNIKYNNNTIFSYAEFDYMNSKYHFDAIIIGGGELFHTKNIKFKDNEKLYVYDKGILWKEPLKLAQKYSIPAIINSVGMPYDFTNDEIKEVQDLLSNVEYISFRDKYSVLRFKKAFPEIKADLVPDSLWKIGDYFDVTDIDDAIQTLLDKYHFHNKKYVLVQYGTTFECLDVYFSIKQFCENTNCHLVYFPINFCHEDIESLQIIKNNTKDSNVTIIDEELSPLQIISLIKNCEMFVGTSLHGNLTANYFGIKSIIIDSYPGIVSKMDGLNEFIKGYFVLNFDELWFMLNQCWDNQYKEFELSVIQENLNNHFDKIANVIQKKENDLFLKKVDIDLMQCSFRKAYLEIWNDEGLVSVKKCISNLIENNNTYLFHFEDLLVNTNERLVLNINLEKASQIEFKNLKQFDSAERIGENIFIDRVNKFAIPNDAISDNCLKIECKIIEVEKINIEEDFLEKYQIAVMNVNQLIRKERMYLNTIRNLERELEKNNN